MLAIIALGLLARVFLRCWLLLGALEQLVGPGSQLRLDHSHLFFDELVYALFLDCRSVVGDSSLTVCMCHNFLTVDAINSVA